MINEEMNFALIALRSTQHDIDRFNYYYKNFIPSNQHKEWFPGFNQTLVDLINLAADKDYTLRITPQANGDSRCDELTHGKPTFAYTDPQNRVMTLCYKWFDMAKTRDLRDECKGKTLEQYQTGGKSDSQHLMLPHSD